MKNILSLAFLLLVSTLLSAQIAPNIYYVQFTDKEGTPYNIDNPSAFLSERALLRRLHHEVPIIEQDLPVNPAYLEAVANTGAELLFPSKWLNGVTVSADNQSILDAINALPFVLSYRSLGNGAEASTKVEKIFFKEEDIGDHLQPTNSVPYKHRSTYNYGNAYTQINQLNGIPLHEDGYRGEGMVMAIIDAGFIGTNTHIAFDSIRDNGQILGTKDFVHPGGEVYNESSHGTSVLSTIAANIPGQMIGTAPKASFWLLRSEFVGYEHLVEEYNWVSAAEFADSVGVDVINSSLGYIDFDYSHWDHVYSDMDGATCVATIGADIASDKGILVFNSAGNSGNNYSFPYIGSPADGFKVFSIGAVKGDGERASFSSIGPTADGRIKPDVMAMGQGTAVAGGNNSFTYSNGTSFSSPVMAGIAACLWQAKPNFKNLEIKDAIMQSGSYASDPDAYMGYGIPDMVLAASFLTSIDTGKQGVELFIDIYPNPLTDDFRIVFTDYRQNLDIKLSDIQGRIVFNGQFSALQTNQLRSLMKQLKSGVYLLAVSNGNTHQYIKLIKP